MTWVKICGITNLEDALVAVEAGADALGFVFYDKSPRKIDAATATEIVSQLHDNTETVGVFVGGLTAEFIEIANRVRVTSVQLHDSNGGVQEFFTPFAFRVYVSVPASFVSQNKGLLNNLNLAISHSVANGLNGDHDPKPTIFLDSSTRERPGGTGSTFDWEKVARYSGNLWQAFNVVVAGGLRPENVSDAMRILHPWGVDVSSGVEASPGKKDPDKVRAFIKAVRDYDKANSRN